MIIILKASEILIIREKKVRLLQLCPQANVPIRNKDIVIHDSRMCDNPKMSSN